MKLMLPRLNLLDGLGASGTLAALTFHDALALVCALVTIAAMLPLAYWRWRAVLRERKAEKAARDVPPTP